ncbi:hypothetical protein Q3G72_028891 [Acer saccharum]|nr:hypothetical protein Q3G72_004351 [Acer saccharum]KAK1583983.1 hypothetical protein Q3G72_028891 [Acer saccharum]
MWRSIAARTRQVALNYGATTENPKKVLSFQFFTLTRDHSVSRPSLCRNSRFFSQLSATDPSDEGSISHETEFSSHGFNQNDNTQTDHFVFGFENDENLGENDDTQMENSMVFDPNSDAQMDDFVPGKVEGEEKQPEVYEIDVEKEPEVYEIDVEKLENVLSLLQGSVDGSLESSLDEFGLDLREDFVVRVLETPMILGENLLRFFKWGMRKPEFKVSTRAVDALVKAICSDMRKKDAYALWDLVQEIGEKESGILNVEILNKLIALLSKLGKGKAALEVFDKFGDLGCVANVETYYFTIEALCRRSIFDWAWSVCEKMIDTGSLPDSAKVGKIICWFCKGKKAKEAHSVYTLAKEKNNYPPQSSVNFLIISLCQKDETVKLALEMLDDFSGEARRYAIKSFSAVIHGMCRMKDVVAAKALLQKMISEGPPPGNTVFNSLITGYSKNGDMEEAIGIMKLMKDRGLKPDVYTYTVVMSGYANGGLMKEACEILKEAKKNHSKLSPVTYHTLIRGYCKLEEFDKALNLFTEMKESGVQPNVDEYNKLIQSLCLKALDWEKAEKLLEEMKEKGMHLNGITRGLIKAVKDLEKEALDNELARTEA